MEFFCDACGDISADITQTGNMSRLDNVPHRCDSCGAPGHFSVDYDHEQGFITWVNEGTSNEQ